MFSVQLSVMNQGKLNTHTDKLITSSRAAQLSGYSQDYVGQLCRNGSITCKRVLGEWKVDLTTLLAYKKRFNPDFNIKDSNSIDSITTPQVLDSSVSGHQDTFTKDGIEYVSSTQASATTGYSQDYIGQLARSGSITAEKVGRRWFVGLESLTEHKKHNDGLLASLQTKSVGLNHPTVQDLPLINKIPIITYKRDDGTEMPDANQEFDNSVTIESGQVRDSEVMDLRQNQNTRHKPINKANTPIEDRQARSTTANINKAGHKNINSFTQITRRDKASRMTVIPKMISLMSLLLITSFIAMPVQIYSLLSHTDLLSVFGSTILDSTSIEYLLNLFSTVVTY